MLNYKLHISPRRGFTIIELVMTLVIVGVIAGIGITAMLSGIDNWGFFMQRKELLVDGRLALDRMVREIRMIKDKTNIYTADSTTFEFTESVTIGAGVYDKRIKFELDSGIIYIKEGIMPRKALLSDVANAAEEPDTPLFTYYDADGFWLASPVVGIGVDTNIRRINIQTVSSRGAGQTRSGTLNLQSGVWPRNLR